MSAPRRAMRAALLVGAAVLGAAAPSACDVGRSSAEVCEDFCHGRCGFYNTSAGDTGGPSNLTAYRLTPANVTGLRNKDLGDAPGDIGYWLTKKNITRECAQDPKAHGCIDDGNNIYGAFTIEVDGQFGPYLMCNPLQGGGADPVQHPVWKDTQDFRCGQQCFIVTKEKGCQGFEKPANGSTDFGDYSCYCDGTGRDGRTVGRAAPPFLSGSMSWAPADWAPQCKAGYYPAPKRTCLRGKAYKTLQGWSFDSTLALACEACSRDEQCAGWATTDNRSVELFSGKVLPRRARGPCVSAWATPMSKRTSWFGVGTLGGLWFSTPQAGECPKGKPLGTSGCTWREVASKYKNASCVDGKVDASVEAFGVSCFSACSQPLNRTSDCYLDCYRRILMGDAATNTTKIPDDRIIQPWVGAFQTEDPSQGGCPVITPAPCEGEQCDPLLMRDAALTLVV